MPDEKAYERLVQAIATGAIAMVGAGSSARVGYPGWQQLLTRLATEAQLAHPEESANLKAIEASDGLVRASEYERILGRTTFRELVRSIYGPENARIDEFHKLLIQVPFQHYLTSNFDRVIETSHLDVHKSAIHSFDFHEDEPLRDFVDTCRSPQSVRTTAHIHGSILGVDKTVLTFEDYAARYSRDSRATTALRSIFSVFSCVFIGCSLSAEDLGPLQFLSEVLGAGEPKHFAVLETPADESRALEIEIRLGRKYRIQPIFYPQSTNHAALVSFIRQLLEDVNTRRATTRTSTGESDAEKLIAATDSVLDKFSGADLNLPTVREQLREAIRAATRGAALISVIVDTSTPTAAPEAGEERTPLDAEIDEIFGYIKRGQANVAVTLYQRILSQDARLLSPRLRYRLRANLGNAYYSMKEDEKAADEYLIASTLRDTRDAKAFAAMAHLIRGNDIEAQRLARLLCAEEPDFGRAHVILIQSLPDETPLSIAERLVPEAMRQEAEVAVALSMMAAKQQRFDEAESYARFSLNKGPSDWAEPLACLGCAILLSERQNATIVLGAGLRAKNIDRVREAETLLTRAISLLPNPDPRGQLAIAYLNRGAARRFLNKSDEADEDTRTAYRQRPQDSEIAAAYALVAERDDKLNEAIHVVEAISGAKDQWRIDILHANFLRTRGTPPDRENAVQLLLPWTGRIEVVAEFWRGELLRLITVLRMDRKEFQNARELLDSIPSDAVPAFQVDLLRGEIESAAGNKDQAQGLLDKVAKELESRGDWFSWREVSVLAEQLGDYRKATSFLKKVVTEPTYFNDDTKRLLRCAHLSEDDAFILDFCPKLRNNGIDERFVYELEIHTLLQCREPAAARDLMGVWIAKHPDDLQMRLQRSMLSLQRGEHHLVERDPARLPSVAQVRDATMGSMVVHLLREGANPISGAEYAYALYRRFPDEIAAQRTLIGVLIGPSKQPLVLPQPLRVDTECAVQFKEEGEERLQLAIVETGKNPSPTRGEYSPDHPLAQSLIGAAAGDEVNFQGRKLRIVSVEHKIVYRARICLEAFERTFPKDTSIKRLKVPSDIGKERDPKKALGEVYHLLESHEQRQQWVEGLYVDSGLPISAMALALGRSVFETMNYLAQKRGVGVRCCAAANEEWEKAKVAIEGAKEVIVDDSAVATIYMLDLHHRLTELPFKCVVADSTIQSLREVISRFSNYSGQRAFWGLENGKLFFHEPSPEQELAWVKSLELLVERLTSHCEIVGGSAMLDLETGHRAALPEALGLGPTDALAVARKRGAVLWTDDLSLAQIAINELKIRRVWTQAVLSPLQEKLGSANFNKMIGKLFKWGYEFTRLSPAIIVNLLIESQWEVARWPASAAIEYVSRFGGLGRENSWVTILLILGLWKRCPKERVASKVVRQILNGIGRKVAGPQIARPIYRSPFANLPEQSSRKRRRLVRMLRRWRSGS